jgi:hypothetical protein
LGSGATWIWGRNRGHDIVDAAGVKIDAKRGVRKLARLTQGGVAEDAIGIHLNRGLAGLDDQEVDEFIIVVFDEALLVSSSLGDGPGLRCSDQGLGHY